MARIYAGGTVIGAPELTHGQTGTAKLVFRMRDTQERAGKVYVEDFVVEAWGAVAEALASQVGEGVTVETKGFPRADGRLAADGKPLGVQVVKVGRAEDLEITSRPQVTAAQAVGVVDDDDPFADQ